MDWKVLVDLLNVAAKSIGMDIGPIEIDEDRDRREILRVGKDTGVEILPHKVDGHKLSADGRVPAKIPHLFAYQNTTAFVPGARHLQEGTVDILDIDLRKAEWAEQMALAVVLHIAKQRAVQALLDARNA